MTILVGIIDYKLDQSEKAREKDRETMEEELKDYENILTLAARLEEILGEMAQ